MSPQKSNSGERTEEISISSGEDFPLDERMHIVDDDGEVVVLYKPRKSKKKTMKKNQTINPPTDEYDIEQATSRAQAISGSKRSSKSKKGDRSRGRSQGRQQHKSDEYAQQEEPEGDVYGLFDAEMSGGESLSRSGASDKRHSDPTAEKRFRSLSRESNRRASEPFSRGIPEGYDADDYDLEQTTSSTVKSTPTIYTANTSRTGSTTGSSSPGGSHNSSFFDIRTQAMIKDMMRFRALKISQVLLAIYVGILTYADMGPPGGLRDQESGLVIDQASPERTANGLILVNGVERAIVATTQFQVICIGITRMSAFFMYPALVFVFISKFRATNNFLSKSPLALYMYKDSHELHIYCGWTIVLFSTVHTIFHLARWGQQGNLYLLVSHFSGLSGLFIILSCLLICIPMTIFREKIRYEVRKNLHYLFIVFAGALVFHTPASAIPNGGFTSWVFGILLIWYFLDASYCYFFMTEQIATTKFSVLSSGVRMTMNVSERFQKVGAHGGICYVCLPWISKDQWHAFSLFENPHNPAERQIFIQKTGDWTTEVHRVLQRETVRPAWVQGPFQSPYDNAIAYDNQILVASGIGITPALSVIRAHKDTRRISLIWAVRDPDLLEFFLRHLYLDHQGWNLIFYTGKKKLRESSINILTNTNICIIEGRPKLNELIPNIIYGVESGLGLPENYSPDTKAIASEMLADRLETSSDGGDRDIDIAQDLACYASELGFHLPTDAISQQFDLFTASSADVSQSTHRRRTSQSIMGHLDIGFRPWDTHPGSEKYVRKLDQNLVLPTWGMLYCGGAKQVLKELENISEDYQIGLHVESFAW